MFVKYDYLNRNFVYSQIIKLNCGQRGMLCAWERERVSSIACVRLVRTLLLIYFIFTSVHQQDWNQGLVTCDGTWLSLRQLSLFLSRASDPVLSKTVPEFVDQSASLKQRWWKEELNYMQVKRLLHILHSKLDPSVEFQHLSTVSVLSLWNPSTSRKRFPFSRW